MLRVSSAYFLSAILSHMIIKCLKFWIVLCIESNNFLVKLAGLTRIE